MDSLIVIAGPTGSGKSDLGIRVAKEFGGEIINCDSLQVFRHFNVGTAKVPVEEREGVPHHLMDICDPQDLFTAGDYVEVARKTLREITTRCKLPVVVGGTGFYLRALFDGLSDGPSRDEDLRKRLAGARPEALHRYLRRLDKVSAERIHPNDGKKLMRAIEICVLARTPATEVFATAARDKLTGYRALRLAFDPPREDLYRRIDVRCERMMRAGLVDEVRSILAMGIPTDAKPFESIGYKQALAVVEGRMDEKAALEDMKLRTRQYAKRQWTWFRKERDMGWITGFGGELQVQQAVVQMAAEFMKNK